MHAYTPLSTGQCFSATFHSLMVLSFVVNSMCAFCSHAQTCVRAYTCNTWKPRRSNTAPRKCRHSYTGALEPSDLVDLFLDFKTLQVVKLRLVALELRVEPVLARALNACIYTSVTNGAKWCRVSVLSCVRTNLMQTCMHVPVARCCAQRGPHVLLGPLWQDTRRHG